MSSRKNLTLRIMMTTFAGTLAMAATAQTNIEKLKAMKVSGTDPNLPLVAQSRHP